MMKILAAILYLIPAMALADYPDPMRNQEQVDGFLSEDAGTKNAIVVTGSSSIRRWHSIHRDLKPADIISRGISGSNFNDLDHYLDDLVLRHRPRAVVIYQGDNDAVIAPLSVNDILAKFDTVAARIRRALPDAHIYVMSVKPSIARWSIWPKAVEINEGLAARANGVDHVDYVDVATPLLDASGRPRHDAFAEDELHLNDKGYRIWSSILRPILMGQP